MNSNLYVNDPTYKFDYKVLQYNVDQAVREEEFEATKWNNRYPRVKQLIDAVDADIVCLQEMRWLGDANHLARGPCRDPLQLPNTLSVNRFLASFDQYHSKVEYRNGSPLAFGQAILYKPQKLFPLKVVTRWLSDTPEVPSDTWPIKPNGSPGFGYLVLGVQFLPVKEEVSVVNGRTATCVKFIANATPFWVFNTHFGMEEDIKDKSCVALLKIVKGLVGTDEFLVCGDFNFFSDRDGEKQRAVLTQEWNDLGKGARTLGGKEVSGTFIGYDHDQFKADLKTCGSRLDHVFSSRGLTAVEKVLYTRTMLEEEPEELTTRLYPSDHLPLVVRVQKC
jgi:endonuclease/exonuclease/phosphatase family metal-dependent hydrolase